MGLVTEKPMIVFDLTQIGRGCLLWGKHCSWKEGKAGFVTSATKEQLIVQYHPGIRNVTNHFIIPVSEAAKGQWEIRWSVDLSEIQTYSGRNDQEQQETKGDVMVEDVAGRIDL